MIFNQILVNIDDRWNRLLSNFNHTILSPQKLRLYADAVFMKGSPLDNVWGFIDGTLRPCSRPTRDQRAVYNGHKRVHGIKFQSITIPSGIIANLYGPVEGRRHDSAMLRMSAILPLMQRYCIDPNGAALSVYGDPAYPLSPQLMAPIKGANLTRQQNDFNRAMSSVRVSVEWMFGNVINSFKYTDFKKSKKIGLSPVAKQYRVSALLTNAQTFLYKNNTSKFFEVDTIGRIFCLKTLIL